MSHMSFLEAVVNFKKDIIDSTFMETTIYITVFHMFDKIQLKIT